MSADAADPSSTLLGIASTTMIAFEDDTIQIPAAIIAHGLNLEIPTVQSLMRSGEVTSRCEKGENEDAGRYRLTFFHKGVSAESSQNRTLWAVGWLEISSFSPIWTSDFLQEC